MAAAKAKCLSLYILLMLITFFSSCQIQARDIKSFSKVSPRQVILSQNDYKDSVSLNSATAEPQPTATPRAATTGHGYGLYGNENNKHDNFHPTTKDPAGMTTTPAGFTSMEEEDWTNGADDDQELIGNANPDFEEFENMAETHQDSINRHNNNAYYSKNNRNYNNRPAYNNHGYNNNNNDHDEYNNNGNSNYYYYSNDKHRPTLQQGMSDTRYLANGKYFYDLESETNNINNGAKVYDQDDNAEQNYNNKANEYQTTTNPGNYNKMNHDNNYWRMSDQKQQGMSDTRFLNNGNYYYHGDNNKNNHQRGAGYMVNGNNDGYNIELTQGRPGVSYGSSHDEEDQQEVAGGFNRNNNNNDDDSKNYKRRYVFDSVEEYEKEEEQRLARKYGYHAP